MAGTKKPKGWAAREQQRKQNTAKNNSKKQQKKRGDIGKEEPRVHTKPWEEEGKKGLEEYTNDVTEENHSQGTIEHSTPSDQKKRVSSCEGGPPLEEGDGKAKGKEPEKETNHLKAKHKTLEEKDPASSSTQQSTQCLQEMVDPCEARPLEKEEDKEVKDKKLEETKKQCITTMEPGGETMESGHLSLTDSSLNSPLKNNSRAGLKEILPPVGGEDAEVQSMDQVAKYEKGSEQVYDIKRSDVLMREKFINFKKTPEGIALNKALMNKARATYPELNKFLSETEKFSAAVALCTRLNTEDGEKKLGLLRKASESFDPSTKVVLKDLVWNKEWGSHFFVWCRAVAILNALLHPSVEGHEAQSGIRNMVSKGEFVRDDHDLSRFMMPNTIVFKK